MDIIDVLRMIAARSMDAQHEALGAIRAQQVRSSMAGRRAERAASLAFADMSVEWSPEEREALASLIQDDSAPRGLDVRVRVNASEKARIQNMADDDGQTVSDFIRSKIGL